MTRSTRALWSLISRGIGLLYWFSRRASTITRQITKNRLLPTTPPYSYSFTVSSPEREECRKVISNMLIPIHDPSPQRKLIIRNLLQKMELEGGPRKRQEVIDEFATHLALVSRCSKTCPSNHLLRKQCCLNREHLDSLLET